MFSKKHVRHDSHGRFMVMLALLATLPMTCEKCRDSEDDELTNYKIHSVVMENGKMIDHKVRPIPKRAFSNVPLPEKEVVNLPATPPREKIHPALRRSFDIEPATKKVRVVINFREDVEIPPFPELNPNEPRDSKANQQVQARVDSLIREIQRKRAARYDSLKSDFKQYHDAPILETYWLVNGVLTEIMLRDVRPLAERPDVLYIAPDDSRERPSAPPDDGVPTNDIDDGRDRIGSDPLFAAQGPTNEYIGLLDTGIHSTHVLFKDPVNNTTTIGEKRDCVSAGNCPRQNLNDCFNHGTASAAIITGSNALGDPFRGVTNFSLDIYKVYTCGQFGGLNQTAAIKAFEKAVERYNRVIVAEIQAYSDEYGAISQAADNAFDAGAAVIAANGNQDDETWGWRVKAPAAAHKVIGVGAININDNQRLLSQCYGPTVDGRHKPDIQAPSYTETASNTSDTALKIFTGTSGSAPYIGGVAALLRKWFRSVTNNEIPEPGQIYAFLVLSGGLTSQLPTGLAITKFQERDGSGPINVPMGNGETNWNAVTLTSSQPTVNIPLLIAGTSPHNLDAALWWAESVSDQHNDIDLFLIDPNGLERARSNDIPGVFERARVEEPLAFGNWTIRIEAHLKTSSEKVYWAAHYKRQ